MHFSRSPRIFELWLASVLFCLGFAMTAWAEDVPKPEEISLETKDGVKLALTYYASTEGKQAVPVVLLHDYKGTRNVYAKLARQLQQAGHAVLTVDLRGHGGSTQQTLVSGRRMELDATKFKRPDYLNMIGLDMEAARKYLVGENDLGKLNLNKLCLVGAGMGSTIAVNWAAQDWNTRLLPSGKQGQDVKALVLISPELVCQGIPMRDALQQRGVQRKVSVLIVCGGKKSKAMRDAKRVHKMLAPFHEEPPEIEWEEKKDLFLMDLNTTNQGTKLFDPPMGLEADIAQFIDLRLVKKDHEWTRRRRGD